MRPPGLPVAQGREMHLPVDQVVDLHEVDALRAQAPHRRFHLRDAGLAAAGPDLGGKEGRDAAGSRRKQRAGVLFGAPVHRRAVDHPATRGEERGQHTGQALVLGAARGMVETEPGAAADDGQRFAGGGDGSGVHGASLRPSGRLRTRGDDAQAGGTGQRGGRAGPAQPLRTGQAAARRVHPSPCRRAVPSACAASAAAGRRPTVRTIR